VFLPKLHLHPSRGFAKNVSCPYPCAKGRNGGFAGRKKTIRCFVVGSMNCHSESEIFLKFLLTRANFSRFNPGDVSWRFRHRDILLLHPALGLACLGLSWIACPGFFLLRTGHRETPGACLGHYGTCPRLGCFWRFEMRTQTRKSGHIGHESKHVILWYNYHELQ
jgi:hypothetical protein